MTAPDNLPNDVIAAIQANRNIHAIKLLRQQKNIGLKEAKEAVDHYILNNQDSITKTTSSEISTVKLMLMAILLIIAFVLYRQFG